jgi:A/G-specific adenine glycosylase
VPGKKTRATALEIISGVLMYQGKVFVQKRLDSGVWAGFWEFPGGSLEAGETPEQGIVREFFEEMEFRVRVRRYLGPIRHAYTRYRILMHCFICEFEQLPDAASQEWPRPVLHAATEYRWLPPEELAREGNLTLPAGHRKLVDAWLDQIIAECGC